LKMGASVDLGDLGSLRVYFPPKMMDNQKDVTAATLKKPKIVFTPKNRMREAANAVEVSVDNPARKTGKESLTPAPSPSGEGSEEHPGPVVEG